MANKQAQAESEIYKIDAELASIEARKAEAQKLLEASFSKSGRAKYNLEEGASSQYEAEIKQLNSQIRALAARKNQLWDIANPDDKAERAEEAREDAAEKAQRAREDAAEKAAKQKEREQQAKTKQTWDDDVEASKRATKTGPPENRPKTAFRESKTTTEETETGGGSTTTKSQQTPEQAEYYRKYQAAIDADQADFNRKREEYLRSKGLENATPAQKRKATNEAQERGELPGDDFEAGAKFRAENPPPKGAPSVTTRSAGDDIKKTETTEEREGASANNAGDKVTAAERPPIVNSRAGTSEGAGTGKDVSGNPTAEPLTAEEKKNLKDSKKTTQPSTAVVKPTKVGQTEVTKTSTGKSATQAKEGTKKSAGDKPTTSPDTKKSDVIVKGGTDKSGDGVKTPARIKITPNPLHNYATYTYSISLHLLTPAAYNDLSDGKDWLPDAKTLIAGGGRWSEDKTDKKGFQRAAQFKDDFYFDGLTVESVIGLNKQGRGTNVYDFSFNIIEPYGFTLIDRLLELSIEMNQPNYVSNPYVIQIDFFGNNEAGEPVHPLTDKEGRSLTKYLPCKIINMQIKVGASGAVYTCRASPYNHAAFAETVAVAPANFEIVASTVGNFFTNDADAADLAKQIEDRARDSRISSIK